MITTKKVLIFYNTGTSLAWYRFQLVGWCVPEGQQCHDCTSYRVILALDFTLVVYIRILAASTFNIIPCRLILRQYILSDKPYDEKVIDSWNAFAVCHCFYVRFIVYLDQFQHMLNIFYSHVICW